MLPLNKNQDFLFTEDEITQLGSPWAEERVEIGTTCGTTTTTVDGGNSIMDTANPTQSAKANPVPDSAKTSAPINIVEPFFPFDPCLLREVHTRIQTFYRVWNGVPGLTVEPTEENPLDLPLDPHGEGHASPLSGLSAASSSVCTDGMSENEIEEENESVGVAMSLASSVGMSPQISNSFLLQQQGLFGANNYNTNTVGGEGATLEMGVAGTVVSRQYEFGAWAASFESEHGESGLPPGWVRPPRRPRQYSIGSNGSW